MRGWEGRNVLHVGLLPCDLEPEDRVLAFVRLGGRHLAVDARKVAGSHVTVAATRLTQRLHKLTTTTTTTTGKQNE